MPRLSVNVPSVNAGPAASLRVLEEEDNSTVGLRITMAPGIGATHANITVHRYDLERALKATE